MPPPMFVERLPIPTLRNFVLFSCFGIGSALMFAWSHAKDFMMEALNSTKNMTDDEIDLVFDGLSYTEYRECFVLAIMSEFWSVLAIVNMCCCVTALIGKGIQIAVFGTLRVSETQQLKEKFWNFVFYKFIFIFGVLNVQYMNDAYMWTAWFTLLCCLQMLAQLCKYRFEYLSCSPATPKFQHVKLIFLLTSILLIGFCLVAASIATALYTDWNIFGFMVAECLLLIVKTVYVIMKYTIYLVDINHDGLWETRGTLAYYTDLVCEIAILSIDLLHYLHMVLWSNIFLSMASIVILMQVRHLGYELQKRVYRHRNYLKVVRSMEARFAEATNDEIAKYDDNCAICWDKMQKARKLPCSHLFHNSCLRSWLAQDTSCPTCRVSLGEQKTEDAPLDNEVIQPMNAEGDGIVRVRTTQRVMEQDSVRVNRTNHFHFDATPYISWFPRFSVAVTHVNINNDIHGQARQPTQLDAMATEVQQVFPNMSLSTILEDLRATRSVDITIDNILEGRLVILTNEEESSDESDSDDEYDDDHIERHTLELNEPLPTPCTVDPEPSASLVNDNAQHQLFPNDPQTRQRSLQDRKAAFQARARQQYYVRTEESINATQNTPSSSANVQEDYKTK